MPAASSPYRGRFAPTPNGPMHPGTAAAALLAHSHAAFHRGRILLRWDDLDPLRCRPNWIDSLRADLAWLGLTDWAEEVFQSARHPAYQTALLTLARRGLVYPCMCSRTDIRRRLAGQTPPNLGQVVGPGHPRAVAHFPGDYNAHYDGHCRGLLWSSSAEAEAHLDSCRRVQIGRVRVPALRLLRPDTPGDDPVIWSPEGYAAYTLACAVDEGDLSISHVVRGADLLPETPLQLAVITALGRPSPIYTHFPVVLDSGGRKLSKSTRAPALRELVRDPVTFRAWVGREFFHPPVGPDELAMGWAGRLRSHIGRPYSIAYQS